MKNKANQLALSVSVAAMAFLCAQPEAAQAQIGVSQLRAPDGSPNPALSVDNDGNVGIGNTSPGSMLSIGSSSGRGTLEVNGATSGNGPRVSLFDWRPSGHGFSIFSGLSTAGNLDIYDETAGRVDLTINGAGNVGIGTATPRASLDVNGNIIAEPNDQGNPANTVLKVGSIDGTALYCHSYGTPFHAHNDFTGTDVYLAGGVAGAFTGDVTVSGQVRCTTLLLTSDRHAKTNFLAVNSHDVLKKVASLPLTTWHYTNAPGVRHLGPMAQDFKAAFNLGEDDKHIATVDADGVALASIQALYEMVQEKDSEIAALQRQVSALKTELAGVKDSVADRLAALEKKMVSVASNARPHPGPLPQERETEQASFRPEAAR